jgi:hypothetical protein
MRHSKPKARSRGAQEVYETLEKSGIPEPMLHKVLTIVNDVISGLFADSSQAWAREREYAQGAGPRAE